MRISDLLRHKRDNGNRAIWTLPPSATVPELLAALAEHHAGAMLVTDGARLAGIVSERDVVRRLHSDGAAVLTATVADLMTTDVVHGNLDDSVDDVATLMTERRIRHLPVLDDGRLVGVVSIGDVVSSRMRELEHDREQLQHYISG